MSFDAYLRVSLLGIFILQSCMLLSSDPEGSSAQKRNQSGKWYKGNTHAHTTMSDGNEPPEYVVKWYHGRGYNFLVLTDHNKFVDPHSVKLPENLRKDFILIPGEEVTGKRLVHTTGLNINRYVHPGYEFNSVTEVIQSHIDSVLSASGVPILNHPNFKSGAQFSDILPVQRLHMFEVFNGYPKAYNWGNEGIHLPVEAKWDSLLTHCQKYFAVASDDAHNYVDFLPERSNPGRGWVMVKATVLSADSIVTAMVRGDFYASNGVILKKTEASQNHFIVEINHTATKEELKSPYLTGNITSEGLPGFLIEFIGSGGKILQKTEGTSASYMFIGSEQYVRCRASYCRKLAENKYEYLYAWTQPVFPGQQ